jgi:hypothetical protein
MYEGASALLQCLLRLLFESHSVTLPKGVPECCVPEIIGFVFTNVELGWPGVGVHLHVNTIWRGTVFWCCALP